MININLIKKALGFKKDSVPKWYGVPHTGKAENHNIMTRNATENTSTAPTKMDSSVELYCKEMIKELLNGRTVRLGRYGTFRIAFRSVGVDNATDYNASSMIKDIRIVFRASKYFRTEVLNNIQFSVTGVTENDIKYASMSDYRRAKGISANPSDPNKPSEGEDGGGGLDENPLG